jgi:hypothetical protein
MVTALKAPSKKSSSIAATGYDAATRTLRVQFHGKTKVYDYVDVDQDTIDAMHRAESIGGFISEHIVGKFNHQAHETA